MSFEDIVYGCTDGRTDTRRTTDKMLSQKLTYVTSELKHAINAKVPFLQIRLEAISQISDFAFSTV